MWRSSFESPEAVSRVTSIVPVTTEFVCKHVPAGEAMRAAGPIRGRPFGTLAVSVLSPTNDRVSVSGLRNEVAEVLDLVAQG
jgi:hypothetical protein